MLFNEQLDIMQLSILLKDIVQVPSHLDRHIGGITLDSRKVNPNDLFLAIKGSDANGSRYITDAISKGASAVLVDQLATDVILDQPIPIFLVVHLQQSIGLLAARFYDYPAQKLRVIGVTGTNGKTSCTNFIAQILHSLHTACGVIGTLGNGCYPHLQASSLTTPDAITLQALLRDFVNQKATTVAMEVSSHSIDQGRINATDFEIGIFTNLTQDHLDYHGTMENYAAVKRRFLAATYTKQVIVNADDAYGRQWIADIEPHKSVFAYSTSKSSLKLNVPMVYCENISLSMQGINATVHSPWGTGEVLLPLIGHFNLSNGLAVLTALCAYGIPFSDVLLGLSRLQGVPGRMQTFGGSKQPLVVVDYSHTPDSLKNALTALRSHTRGKLICVFGCGGNRDKSKRPIMAAIAEQFADEVIITNDNPRHEIPNEIAADILKGFADPERVKVELDRSKAILNSIQWATEMDCILIAGKGAETYQQIGDEKIPFDDTEQVKNYLKNA